MRNTRVFRALLGVQKTVIEAVEVDEERLLLVVRARPARQIRGRNLRARPLSLDPPFLGRESSEAEI